MAQAKSLPARPNLEYLRKLAKERLAALRETNRAAKLAVAQLEIAREYGFASWRALHEHVQSARAGDPAKISELMTAISSGDTPRALQLITDHPVIVNQPAAHPMWGGFPQPLHVAIESGREEIFTALLDAGADLNGDNTRYDGWSPLMLSIQWNRQAMMLELIGRGVKSDLIAALMLDDVDSVASHLKHADWLRGPFPNQASPLHFVRSAKAARLLLDAGVDASSRDKHGRTPANLAATKATEGPAILKLLEARGALVQPWMFAASNDIRQLRARITKDPGLAKDPTLLFAAIAHGDVKTVTWLLDHGADPNAREMGKSRQTALHAAAWAGKLDVAKLLLSRGADPKAIDEEHRTTPLIWARTALERLNRAECQGVIDHLESLESKAANFDPDELARNAVKKMERAWAESTAMIEQRFADIGDTPRWEATGLHSPTLREREADAAIARGGILGQYRMISVWHAAKIEPGKKTFMEFPPTRALDFFRDGDAGTKPAGGLWRRIDWRPTRDGLTGKSGRSDDLAEALTFLRDRAPEGEYRVITVRRMLLARKDQGKLKVIKKHGSGPMPSLSPVDPSQKPKPKKEWSVESLPKHRKSHKIAKWKPIMDAAFCGDSDKVVKLLDAGADPNVISTTPQHYRPLHRAIEHKKTAPKHEEHEQVVRTLLDRGADPKQRGTYTSLTALQLAAIDEPRFVPLLVDRFRPLDLFHAIVLLDEARVMTLLKSDRSLAKSRDVNGWSTLHYAAAAAMYKLSERAAQAQLKIVRELLAAGADPMASFPWPSQHQWPMPVMYYSAGLHDNPAVTKLLLDAGATPFDNESVYHAADEKHQECLDLFEQMCDAKKLATECTRCLASQFHWGHTAGVKWLLEHGADPNAVHPWYGQSALHIAICGKFSEKVIDMLFAHGADVQVKNTEGRTGLQLARAAGAKMLARVNAAARR